MDKPQKLKVRSPYTSCGCAHPSRCQGEREGKPVARQWSQEQAPEERSGEEPRLGGRPGPAPPAAVRSYWSRSGGL